MYGMLSIGAMGKFRVISCLDNTCVKRADATSLSSASECHGTVGITVFTYSCCIFKITSLGSIRKVSNVIDDSRVNPTTVLSHVKLSERQSRLSESTVDSTSSCLLLHLFFITP